MAKLASAGPIRRCDDGQMRAVRSRSGRLADALAQFADAEAIPQLTPVVAGLREVAEPVDPVREYRAIRRALAEISTVAGELADERIAAWLSGQTVVLTTMAAAVAVVESAGLRVDRRDEAAAHLNRARYWRGYSSGPVSDLHRHCGQDISRGSLRLLGARRRVAVDARVQLQRVRLQLITAGRARSVALRAELAAVPIGGRGGAAAFRQRVHAALSALFAAADVESARALAEVSAVATTPWPIPALPDPPAGPRPDERRLSAVLGAGFGLGVALATMRLVSGLAGLPETDGVAWGVVVGLVLTGWVVVIRGRLQTRAALDRWVLESIAVVRQGAEDELARRYLDAQQQLNAVPRQITNREIGSAPEIANNATGG